MLDTTFKMLCIDVIFYSVRAKSNLESLTEPSQPPLSRHSVVSSRSLELHSKNRSWSAFLQISISQVVTKNTFCQATVCHSGVGIRLKYIHGNIKYS